MDMEIVSGEKGGIAELIQALDQATLMAKQLPTNVDSSQLLQIYSSLQSAHQHLSIFLSQSYHHHPPPPFPENSVSSAVGGEPMQVGDEEDGVNETELNSKTSVDRVEERMRDCFIQNKRPKRPLSPASAVAEQRRSYDNDRPDVEFDPHGTKLRSLDLIYQFHS
ncbi:uncharacterized protein LOC129886634 [Solanum dulcamara]|uniref:uncharacterized protein LOC129886634 n=1 Tax=Solanum dulcamara TaxID=45834 RepID=UPI00248528D1|nr:uncharacterized protein LOC129886634 [Solanum dulcamara]